MQGLLQVGSEFRNSRCRGCFTWDLYLGIMAQGCYRWVMNLGITGARLLHMGSVSRHKGYRDYYRSVLKRGIAGAGVATNGFCI